MEREAGDLASSSSRGAGNVKYSGGEYMTCTGVRRAAGIERGADCLKLLEEAEKKAADPEHCLMMDEDYDSDWDAEEGEMLEDTLQFWCRLKRTWSKMMEGEGEEEDLREVGGRDVGDESGSGAGMDGDAGRQLGDGDCRVGEGEEDDGVALMDSHQFDGVTRRRVWDGGK